LEVTCIWIRIQEFIKESILQRCEMRRFSTTRLTSLKHLIGSSWKFYHRGNFGYGSPCWILEFIRKWSLDPDSGYGVDLPWWRSAFECF